MMDCLFEGILDPGIHRLVNHAGSNLDRSRGIDGSTGQNSFHAYAWVFIRDTLRQQVEWFFESIVPTSDDASGVSPGPRILGLQESGKETRSDDFEGCVSTEGLIQVMFITRQLRVQVLDPAIESLADSRCIKRGTGTLGLVACPVFR